MPTCAGSKGNAARNRTSNIARWLILLFVCWINFGNFYAFDNPSALNRQLGKWLDISEDVYGYQFMLFYSIYSIPNIFIPFLMGGLLDIYGTRALLMLLSGIVCIGQGIFAIGGQFKIFPVMLFGRLIFGFGGESLAVAQARLITDWFSGNELCLAIGITLAISRLGLVCNNVLSPIIHDLGSLSAALWAGFGFCLLSYGFTYISVILDTRLSHVRVSPLPAPIECGLSLEKPTALSRKPLNIKELLLSTPKIVNTFHPAFFVLCGSCFVLNGSIIPFNNIASDFLQRKWYEDTPSKAAWTMSIPDTMAIFLIPIIGYAIDYFGYKVAYIVGGGFAMGLGHYILAGNIASPIIPLIINGFASSSVVAIWPCIPALVPEMYWATAYGIITACINASYTFVPLIVAVLENLDHSYGAVELFFALQSILGAFLTILFYYSRKATSPNSLLGSSTITSGTSTLLLARLEELPRAPTFSGPPESLFWLLDDDTAENDDDDDDMDGSHWNSYDENVCNEFKLHRHSYLQRYPFRCNSESTLCRSPQIFKHHHHHHYPFVHFSDDSQLEVRGVFSNVLRKRSSSIIGI